MAGQWCTALPGHRAPRLAAGMTDLNACCGAISFDRCGELRKARDEVVLPDAEIPRCARATGVRIDRFDENEAGVAISQLAVMQVMQILRIAVVGRVGQHGRDDDAVADANTAQVHRREQQAFH